MAELKLEQDRATTNYLQQFTSFFGKVGELQMHSGLLLLYKGEKIALSVFFKGPSSKLSCQSWLRYRIISSVFIFIFIHSDIRRFNHFTSGLIEHMTIGRRRQQLC